MPLRSRPNGLIAILSLILMLSAFIYSCSDESKNDNSSLKCNGEQFICQGEWLQICGANGKYAYESCSDICAEMEQIPTGECLFDENRGHDFCVCVDECCEEETQRCAGASLEVCNNCIWIEIDCEEICGASGKGSAGCGIDRDSGEASCLCDGVATDGDGNSDGGFCPSDSYIKCEEALYSPCGDSTDLATTSCREKCEDLEYYFDYCGYEEEEGKEVCHCTETKESKNCIDSEPVCTGDFISACKDGEVTRFNCLIICDDAGMEYDSCGEDPDRGHDVCFCTPPEED